VVPEEWHQGIIIPLYKGKESKSECSNYRGITLLSLPDKVFAHIILAKIKPTLCHHSCCHAELRKSGLEVTAGHLNEAEAVQHVYLTSIPVWFGLLGDI